MPVPACAGWRAKSPNLEEARAAAMRSVRDGTRAAEIISRIRLLFKKGTPQRELVDVNEVIREMIALLRSEATRYSISVRTELAADLPQIMGDRVPIAAGPDEPHHERHRCHEGCGWDMRANHQDRASRKHQLMVSVSDTGVGLPLQRDQIFNAFFTTKPHGTGMGLSISRTIVESHGGPLVGCDNPSRGASLCFTLPARVEAHA